MKRNQRIARRDKVSQVLYEIVGWVLLAAILYGLMVWAIISRPV